MDRSRTPALYAVAKGENIPISSGCKKCVVCGGRHNGIIFEAIQNRIAAVVICDAWPSSISSLYSSSPHRVSGSKHFLNHSRPISLSVHPLSDKAMWASGSAENKLFGVVLP